MESDTEKDAREWSEAVKAHIEYANSTFTGDHAPGAASERGSKRKRLNNFFLKRSYTIFQLIVAQPPC